MQNVRLEFEKEDSRPALVLDNVQDGAINGLNIKGSMDAESLLRITNSKDILFTATRILTPCQVLLSLEGPSNEGIQFDGGDLRKAKKQVVYSGGANDKALKIRI